MVDSNKILTVSYGTFSCTLEGFDDAFETMKAIAEYFRDLAADDRFFGAEPPTPDAEMMARIAERGSARRVEARASDDGIVLRSGEAAAAGTALPAAAAPAPRTATPAAPVAAVAEDEAAEDDFAAEDMPPAAAGRPAALPMADEDSIVAKLRRIRSVVSRNGATAGGDYAEDQDSYETPRAAGLDASALYEATVTPEATEDAALADLEDEISAAEARNAQPADMADDMTADEAPAETAGDEAAALGSVDEAEEEIVAADEEIVGDDAFEEVEAFEDADEDEDTVAEDAAFEEEENAAFEEDTFEAEEDAAFEETDAADTFEDAAYDDDDEDDDASAEDAPVAGETRHQPDTDHDDDAEHHHRTFPVAAATAAAAATGWPRVVKVKRRDMEAVAARNPAVAAASGLSAEQEAELQNELAELEAEMAAEARGIPAEEAYEEDIDSAEPAYDDRDEDDADADYAGTEAEPANAADEAWDEDDEDAWEEALAEDDTPAEAAELDDDEVFFEDDEIAAEAPAEVPQAPSAPAGRAKFDASANPGDMDRILAETNNQLHETEGTRRRSAIQHLRAAVAATKAEQQAGSDLGAGKDEDHTNAYREDLAQVVRPRRPRTGGTTGRRTEDKPAPLRLVAEQRVDIEAEHRAPVRPRRVSIADLIRQEADDEEDAVQPDTAKGEGFPAFLEDSGAEDLAEVLEAAASYLAFVEGREQFSRPQLMNRVREVDPDGYSREDALRAFGSLLREGKIRKVKGGRFAASDRIGFRPDQRAVG